MGSTWARASRCPSGSRDGKAGTLMGYEIEAFVAKEALLREHRSAFRNAYLAPLGQGFALIPLTRALFDEVNRHAACEDRTGLHGFELLSPAIAAWAERISREGQIAYVEAGYFGGSGSQM